jgi:hypothetical protein
MAPPFKGINTESGRRVIDAQFAPYALIQAHSRRGEILDETLE